MGKLLHLLHRNNSGQTLVEAVVALAAIVIIMTAISVVSTTGISNSTFEKNQGLASKFAKQGMEYVRYLRNTGDSSVSSLEGIYCMPDTNGKPSIVTSGCQLNRFNIQNEFDREVEFNQSSTDCVGQTKVSVRVKWVSSKCDQSTQGSKFCHKSEVISCFDTNKSNSL